LLKRKLEIQKGGELPKAYFLIQAKVNQISQALFEIQEKNLLKEVEKVTGPYDLLGIAWEKSPEDLEKISKSLRASPSIERVVVLQVLK
jgi:hypothetical protein